MNIDQSLTIASYIIIPAAFLVLLLLVLDRGSKGPLTKAYKAGKRARRKGKALRDCPSDVGSRESFAWIAGFNSSTQ